MCGIAGFFGDRDIDESVVQRTLDLMKRRGPDHQDWKRFRVGRKKILYLLHSRLGIVDIGARANQPFTIDSCSIVFNGEIYNYLELRKDLEKRGIRLLTHSDTEVLLRYYVIYGADCVKHFEGMWAFVIWDEKTGQLFFSRDRFGEKPLFLCRKGEEIYFGSEVKFIEELRQQKLPVNYDQLRRYLANGYKSLYKKDERFLVGLDEVPRATNLLISSQGRPLKTWEYWITSDRPALYETKEEAVEVIRQELIEAVRLRIRSDVNVGFCLSGGVDSAALVSIASKVLGEQVNTYSIVDEDPRYDESSNILKTVEDTGCRSHLIGLDYTNIPEKLENLIKYHDSPIATITYFVHSLLISQIKEDGIRVVISGTGADELFTGYYDHFLLHLHATKDLDNHRAHLEHWSRHIKPLVRNENLQKHDLYIQNPLYREHIYDGSERFSRYFIKEFKEAYEEKEYHPSLLRNRMLNELFHEVTPVILNEDDLNSMYYSVENRSPYLSSGLFKCLMRCREESLIQNGYAKYLLRESMRGILNEEVRLDRQKKGFNASITSLLDFSKKSTEEWFLDTSGDLYRILDRSKIRRLLSSGHIENDLSKFLFNVLNAKIFLEQRASLA